MRVAVFGAGALGAVYGVRLALRSGGDVAFVVRRSRLDRSAPLVIESVRGAERETLETPAFVDAVPADADAILLAVGTEDLDAIAAAMGTTEAPIVVLTPMFPTELARLRAAFGDRVFTALPSVIAYARKDGVVRYWRPPVPTRIDEPRTPTWKTEVNEVAEALTKAGLRARLELGVHEDNPATTSCFIAIPMLIAVAGSVDALLADEALTSLASRACREGVRLGDRLGRPEPWARLAPALAAPWAMRLWLGGMRTVAPEALFYVEEHFGRKLFAQHRVMIRDMIDLAKGRGLPHEALDEVAARLATRARATSLDGDTSPHG